MRDVGKTPNGCGRQNKKKVNGPKKDEGIDG
jgi:hypothetical protein